MSKCKLCDDCGTIVLRIFCSEDDVNTFRIPCLLCAEKMNGKVQFPIDRAPRFVVKLSEV